MWSGWTEPAGPGREAAQAEQWAAQHGGGPEGENIFVTMTTFQIHVDY